MGQPLQIFRHKASIKQALSTLRKQGKRIAIVPTMGNLHAGHLQLILLAQQHADIVVATIFVNPLQFGLNEDWEQYPRTLDGDVKKLQSVNCDFLFAPADTEMYPHGMVQQSRVFCPTMTSILCGASRPGHFEGVTTVVMKLFNIIEPDVAIFGNKDYQQICVIRRMVDDLCMNVEIVGAPIARESDQLALSSRNRFIETDERERVTILYETLSWVADEIMNGRKNFIQLEKSAKEKIITCGFKLDYASVREAKGLEPAGINNTNLVVLGAMYTKNSRLIDNVILTLKHQHNLYNEVIKVQ